MRTLTSAAVLLCSISISCVLCLESSTVEVQSGHSASLLCSNFTSSIVSISWYRAVKRSDVRRLSVISSASQPPSYTDDFNKGRFTVTSNLSHIFLTISPVNSSDTGLYFCGHESTLGLVIKSSTYLDVHKADTGWIERRLLVPVLSGSVVFLTLLLIGLAVKNKRLRKAQNPDRPGQTETECAENLHYASVHFKRTSGSAKTQPETDAGMEMSTYAAVKRTGQARDSL